MMRYNYMQVVRMRGRYEIRRHRRPVQVLPSMTETQPLLIKPLTSERLMVTV